MPQTGFRDDVMPRLVAMIRSKLVEPWQSRVIELVGALGTAGFRVCFSGMCLLQGRIVDIAEDGVKLIPNLFCPGIGFVEKNEVLWEVFIPKLSSRSMRWESGDSLTLFGKFESFTDDAIVFCEDVCLTPTPKWDWESPVNAFHLFSGSFGGWSQACECLFENASWPPLGQQVCIDSDPVTMEQWSRQVGAPYHQGRTPSSHPWNPSSHIGVCTPVDDISFMHQVSFLLNSVGTASPPCVSWSKGGKSQGLNSDPGFAFVEAVIDILALRPNLQIFECADEICQHHHFGLVSHILKLGGFKRVWQQVVQYHHLSDNKRDRWLSVWIRADHEHEQNSRQYSLCAEVKVPWHSTLYSFAVPQEFQDGLRLTENMMEVYGSRQFLPPAKKARLSTVIDREHVVMHRVASRSEPLPTCCAMYGRQHELDSMHLAQKGIFASLVVHEGSFSLIEPTRIAALLGGVKRVSLPVDPIEAFHGFGNAISVPQAALALLVGLQAINQEHLNIENLVHKVWNSRLTTQNAVIVVEGNFLSIVKASLLCERLSFRPFPMAGGALKFVLTPISGSEHVEGSCNGDLTVAQFLSSCVPLATHTASQFTLRHGPVVASAIESINDLTLLSWSWELCAAATTVATIHLAESNSISGDPEVSPTCPFATVDQIETIQVPDSLFDQESVKDDFLALIKFFETASENGLFGQIENAIPTVLCCVDPQIVFVTSRADGTDFEEIHGILHRFGFFQWSFHHLEGRSVRLPQHEWWVLSDPRSSQNCIILENLTSIIDLQVIELKGFVTPQTRVVRQEQSYLIQRINGTTFDGLQSHECKNGDVFSLVHQDPQLRRVENTQRIFAGGHPQSDHVTWHLRSGANLSERCEFAINTNGWCASDELLYAMKWLLMDQEAHARSFAIVQEQESDFDESTFAFPQVHPDSTTWFAILSGSHWFGSELTRCGDEVQITFLGLDSLKAHRLTQIFARRLDTTGRKIQTFVHAFPQPFNMCGWALLFRWFEKLHQHDQLHSYEEDLEDLVEWKYTLIQDVLSSSIEDWIAADAPPELWHFAHQIRLGCFYHMAMNENDAAPVIDHAVVVELPRGPSLLLPGRVLLYDEYDRFMKEFQNRRIDEFHKFPGWLGSDVADGALQLLRYAHPEIAITAPIMWNSQTRAICTFSGYKEDCRFHTRAVAMILYDQHWISCELHRQQDLTIAWVLAPQDFAHDLSCLVDQLQRLIGFGEGTFQLIHLPCDTQLGLCGWTLLHELFIKLEVTMPKPGMAVTQCTAAVMDDQRLAEAILRANELWSSSSIAGLQAFAQDATIWYLYDLFRGRFTPAFASGGALTQGTASAPSHAAQPMDIHTDKAVDLLQIRDPWAKKTPASQAKWEDLRLDSDHPFRLSDKTVVPQVHRHQLTGAKGGIVMITKNQLTEVAKIQTKQPLAALIPVIEQGQLQQFSKLASGPFEVVVHDGAINTSYKRIVTLITFEGNISYTMTASPAFEFKTNAIAEIVIEVDNRLCAKEVLESIRDNPLKRIQALMQEKFPQKLDQSTFYAFRQNRHPSGGKQDYQYQCIMKISHDHRKILLQASGFDGLLLRDFLERNHSADDLTILPKFWPCSQKGLHEINIAAQALPGNAGVSLTKRGLALRVWISHIKEARKHLLPNDIRLCEENMHIIPKCQVASSGWPPGAAPIDIVKATLKATSLAAIPLRTYRSAGVHVWILCFEKMPADKQFYVAIDSVVHEILLTEYQPQQFAGGKASGKGKDRGPKKPKDDKPSQAVPPTALHERARIDALESRFEQLGKQVTTIEQRQSSFENKFDTRFDEISDVLRQLLNQSTQRSRDATGESPPTKFSRQGP